MSNGDVALILDVGSLLRIARETYVHTNEAEPMPVSTEVPASCIQ
jgi:hypothetical protein